MFYILIVLAIFSYIMFPPEISGVVYAFGEIPLYPSYIYVMYVLSIVGLFFTLRQYYLKG